MNNLFVVSALVLTMGFTTFAEAKAKTRMSKPQAKKECLTDNPSLSGKELQKCIKGKRK